MYGAFSLKLKDNEMIKWIKNLFSKRDKCTIHSVSKSFTPTIGEMYEVIESEQFNRGDLVTILEKHPQHEFWVIGGDYEDPYNETIHVSNLKEIN